MTGMSWVALRMPWKSAGEIHHLIKKTRSRTQFTGIITYLGRKSDRNQVKIRGEGAQTPLCLMIEIAVEVGLMSLMLLWLISQQCKNTLNSHNTNKLINKAWRNCTRSPWSLQSFKNFKSSKILWVKKSPNTSNIFNHNKETKVAKTCTISNNSNSSLDILTLINPLQDLITNIKHLRLLTHDSEINTNLLHNLTNSNTVLNILTRTFKEETKISREPTKS